MAKSTTFTKDLANNKLHVTHEFAAPLEKVWKAWTESNLLDKWWGPKPWHVETVTMDFTDGGLWLYAMVSPGNEKHYSRVDIGTIVPQQSFTYATSFCDEHGTTSGNPSLWNLLFFETETGSKVEIDITFKSDADMQKLIAMGFEGGFTMGLGNLDELLLEL